MSLDPLPPTLLSTRATAGRQQAHGLHHFCFKAQYREQVDDLYTQYLLKNKIHIFDKPAHYGVYTPNYYAVFFVDPDGIKLEFAYY